MKKHSLALKALSVAALMTFATTANAQFGNVLNKVKDKTVNSVKKSAKKAADKAIDKAKEKAYQKAYKIVEKKVLGGKHMPELPWTMDHGAVVNLNAATSGGDGNVVAWLWSLGDVSEAEAEALRAKMEARYKANNKIILAQNTGVFASLKGMAAELLQEVSNEQARYWAFYDAVKHILNTTASGMTAKGDGTCDVRKTNAGIIAARTGGGIGVMLGLTADNKGRFHELNGMGTYLEDDQLAVAQDAAKRAHNIAILLKGVDGTQDDNASLEGLIDKTVFGESGFDTDWAFETDRAEVFARLTDQAIASNSPANIERRAMPRAGALNASQKAKALALAKAEDANVVDVVITSKSWTQQRNELGIPTHRTISGYWILKTKHGKRAVSHMWAQDHMGGGKYSALRNHGIGNESFYVK
ncbi:MAG: hypothetical protein J6I60_03410 [Bacteroidaceae bacterium]|nr:hypothetical protein [Bacteroidaceae bacterium]